MRPRPAARCSSRPRSTCRPAPIAAARRGASGLAGGVAVAAILLGLVLPGTAFAAVPQPGTDVMRAAGSVEITVDGIGTDYVRLIGDVTIVRHPPDPGMPEEIPTEIVAMNLAGFSPVFGRVGLQPCIRMPSTGLTQRVPGMESPSNSFFDVWVDISLPDRGMDLTQAAYFRIEARTTAVPFFDVFTNSYSQMVPLVDDLSGTHMGSLTHLALDPNPQIDRLATQAQLDWTLGTVREIVDFSGVSMVVASDSWSQPGPSQVPEFNTELIAMDLTGATPIHGPMEFHEQMQIHSPGRSVAKDPGPTQFPADSFFDVFFEISGFFSPGSPGGASAFSPADAGADPTFYNASGALVLGSISSWPALNTPFKSPGPIQVPLFDRGTGEMVGTANGLQWVWTQPAGDCVDADGDGVFAPPCGTDCDDSDPNNYPGNLESCTDGRDNNCNQAIDCQDPLCVGRPCDDGNLCTQDDRCIQAPIGGICRGTPVSCDDNNPCTQDFCATATGLCGHVPIFDVACDDGDACTQGDRCVQAPGGGAICRGVPNDCDDGKLCTTDSCDPLTGQCAHAAVTCFDDDPCTDDRCLATTGECVHEPKSCNDFDLCTSDSCQGHGCVEPDNGGGTADLPAHCPYNADDQLILLQADGTILFVDTLVHKAFTCPPATPAVCSFPSPVPGVDCSQAGGTLLGEEACADSVLTLRFTHFNPITNASPSRTVDLPVSFEMHAAPRVPGAPVQSFGTDMFRLFGQLPPGDPDFGLLRFTAGDDFGLPSPGHTTLTQAGGSWAVDSFFDITYRIDFVGAPGSFLAGFNYSVGRTARFSTRGGCVNVPVNCDDNDPCTADRCDPETGACLHAPLSCDDGDACTTDSCDPQTGTCLHAPVVCDDGNSCTMDACDPETGQCRFTPTPGAPCSDGDPCTKDDRCVPGPIGPICQGVPVDCDDNDPCTLDRCNPATGACEHVPVNCDDQNPCTIDRCNPLTGACEHLPINCDDGNQCTRDFCDPEAGACRHDPLVGQTCSDGNDCTEDDRCVPLQGGGVGCQGTPVNCDDQNPCTQDGCLPSGCIVPDNGTGTATMPPQCPYASDPTDPLRIIGGLPAGTEILIPAVHGNFSCTMGGGGTVCSFAPPIPGVDCDQAGGSLGGEQQCSDSTLAMNMTGTGTLAGFNRMINLPMSFESHAAPRTPGDPVQSFDTDVFRWFGQISNPSAGDPDFDLLRITAGTDFGLVGPGHTVLNQQGGNWAVDSFFDIVYRIDFVGRPGGALSGMSGSTMAQTRFRTRPGGCMNVPVNCDDGDPCTNDSCDPSTGACRHDPVTCDDGNQCTRDYCDPDSGVCKHDPLVGQACDDGNDCTDPDRCVQDTTGGVSCQGPPVNCDDQDPCTQDTCLPSGCIVPDNGTGTATLPPQGCGYATGAGDDLQIIDGLPLGSAIDIPSLHRSFVCPPATPIVCSFPSPIPGVDCDQAGGSLGGEQACADSILELHMMGTGALLGFNRIINLPVGVEENAAPRTPGAPVQSFNAEVFRLFGQILNPSAGDPDFDLLRITGGNDFGMPSPGHTTLTQAGPNWAVDSFFDITYRIDFVGRPGGALTGMSGSTTGTARFRTQPGGCVHAPVDCDDHDPCTTDRCNPDTGLCEHLPVQCDDGNQCTRDFCDPDSGLCRHDPLPGAPCDDGDACTQDDKCVPNPAGGIGCQGAPVDCDDLNPCTFDRCDPGTGLCVHVLNTCDDGDACTQDACDPATGACEHRPVIVMEPDPIKFGDQVTIDWSATPDASHWNTYRGSIPMALLGSRLPVSVYDQACFESDDAGANGPTTAIDAADPPLGTAFYYLTSGESACGESFIGHPSSPPGAVIPNTMSCPTPP